MNIYLIYSESIRMIEEKVLQLTNGSSNIIKYNMQFDSFEDILEEAAYISLIPEMKYIVVKNANCFSSDKVKESDSELLLNYFKQPNINTTLIFTTSNKIDERKKIVKTIKENYQYINIPKMKEYDLNKKISELFKKDNYKIDFDSIKYISKQCLYNYDLIYNEIEKIKIFYLDNKNVEFNDIKNFVSSNLDENIFKLVNAITEKQDARFKIYKDLKILKVEPIALISLLAREYRSMYLIKSNSRYYSREELCKLLNIQAWQFEAFEKKAYSYTINELKDNLLNMYELDLDIKSGNIDKYLAFELFLISL